MNIKEMVSLKQRKEKFKVLETNILQRDAEFKSLTIVTGEVYSEVMWPHKGLDPFIHSTVFTEYVLCAKRQ